MALLSRAGSALSRPDASSQADIALVEVERHGSGEPCYCVLFNSEKGEGEHDVTRNFLLEPSGSQTHPVTLASGR